MRNLFFLFLLFSFRFFGQDNNYDSIWKSHADFNRNLIKTIDIKKIEISVIDSINKFRKSKNKNVLVLNDSLFFLARSWSDFIINETLESGKDTLYGRHSKMKYIENCYNLAYPCTFSNLKLNFFYQKTPSYIFNAWFKSSGHNAGMLMDGKTIGIGISYGVTNGGVLFCFATMLIE